MLLEYGPLNTAFLFAVCVLVSKSAYRWAFDTANAEYKDFSRLTLLIHMLFVWIGGGAFAAVVMVGMINYGQLDPELWMFLFMIIVIPSIWGLVKGIEK